MAKNNKAELEYMKTKLALSAIKLVDSWVEKDKISSITDVDLLNLISDTLEIIPLTVSVLGDKK